jgi:hypothetical protein
MISNLNYRLHSFCRLEVIVLVNKKLNCQELMLVGHWKNLKIAKI